MKPEYHQGPQARKKFEEGMTKLFQVKKVSPKESKPKPKRKRRKTSKG